MSELGVALAFAKAGIAIIPVRLFREGDRLRKRPHIKAWRQRASTDASVVAEWWREFPEAVPGIVLEHSGFVVVDCDRHVGHADGVAAFAALGEFPPHPIVRTPSGGEHHYFLQPEPPIAAGSFADGIDLLDTSRFVVAPGSAGYELEVGGETPALPEIFLGDGCSLRQRNRPVCVVHDVSGFDGGPALEALSKLDPVYYRNHDRWLRLMMSAHAAGVDRDDFIDWSTSDPMYADDADEIAVRWDSLRADGGITARTLFVEARMAELFTANKTHHDTHTWSAPITERTTFTPTLNPRRRINSIVRLVEKAEGEAREPTLFNVACLMREIIAEGVLWPKPALSLLESACRANRLWREDRGLCRRAIASAFLTVELKLLKPKGPWYVLAPGALREWHGYGTKGRYQLAQEYVCA